MRARNLKPAFFKNEDLAELPFEYRMLFQGLWCLADREGRLQDRPKRIKADVFPYDDVDIVAGINALAEGGFLTRYAVDGRNYLQISNFVKHQSPHVKEAASTIPAPCEPGAKSPESPFLNPPSPIRNPESPSESQKSAATRRLAFSEWDAAFARRMHDDIVAVVPSAKEPSFDAWANDIRLLREQDSRSETEIESLWAWANADSFWRSVLLSPRKLREKWTQLDAKRGSQSRSRGHPQNGVSAQIGSYLDKYGGRQ